MYTPSIDSQFNLRTHPGSSMAVVVHIPMLVVQLVDFDTAVDHHSNAYKKVKKDKKMCWEDLQRNRQCFGWKKWNVGLITLVPCHCIAPHVNRFHCDAHDAVNQNLHNSRHDDHVTTLVDHFYVSCSLGHCLIA